MIELRIIPELKPNVGRCLVASLKTFGAKASTASSISDESLRHAIVGGVMTNKSDEPMGSKPAPSILSVENLFDRISQSGLPLDPEVIQLVKNHLGSKSPHSKAGANLATALLDLAKQRAEGGAK